ncbi:MFS transporter [Brachyspira catarrhinii]|uniref:MFS transporter n=1 Tax=Brachyspira catarrhinii TaxID=2528966 RepID=A0ABY2TNX6_9SPIR|nr:MFS transporter [Brachyspira catarrhinii]TKZ29290.1 MFS transporter [Brachyspira catarrhinii]
MENLGNRDYKMTVGFIGGVLTLASVYAASSSPIPLFKIYAESIGLSNGFLSLTAAVYFLGAITGLLVFSKISNYLGMRPVIFAILILTAFGCLIFIKLNNGFQLTIGRFIQGLSCGMVSSSVSSYIFDTAKIQWLASASVSGAPMVGLSLGSIGSGIIAGYENYYLIFEIIIFVLIVCGVLIFLGKETVIKSKFFLRYLKPEIYIPKNVRNIFPSAITVFVSSWAIGGFYQAFSSSMAFDYFHSSNVLIASLIFLSLFLPNILGGFIAGKFGSAISNYAGITGFLISVIISILALWKGILILFLIGCIFESVFWGIAFTKSISDIIDKISKEERTGVLSSVYIISYSAAGIPNLIVGRIAHNFSIIQIFIGYGMLVFIAFIFNIYFNIIKK